MLNEIDADDLVKAVHQAALARGTLLDQVPDIPEGEPFAQEWRAFKREVYRLMKEGHTGKFAAFKGDRVVGIWDTLLEAVWHGYEKADNQECLVQEIQLYVKPVHWGYRHLCRS